MCRYLFRAAEQEKQSIADNIVGFMNGTGNLSKEAYRIFHKSVISTHENPYKSVILRQLIPENREKHRSFYPATR